MAAKILIVDDEESIREFLEDLLEGKGYECQTAADGRGGAKDRQAI